MGNLGRDRCFFISPGILKLPSDLSGIESPKFQLKRTERSNMATRRAALEPGCSRIAAAIHRNTEGGLPSRAILSNEQRAGQKEIRRFYDQIKGDWWERISWRERTEGVPEQVERLALSFFTIGADDLHSSVRLAAGHAYSRDGVHRAAWRSAAAHLEPQMGRIVYVRECKRSDARSPKWLPGLGKIDFEIPADSASPIERGDGDFWEGDETHPEEALVKRVDVRRIASSDHLSIMRGSSSEEKRSLIASVLDAW
jgi:hypothetical protein